MVDYTLPADPLALVASPLSTAAMTHADTLGLALDFPSVSLLRNYEADLGPLTLKLNRIVRGEEIINSDRTAALRFQRIWQRHCEAIELAFGRLAASVEAIQAAYDAAAQAGAAAVEAQAAVAEVQTVATEVETAIEALTTGELPFDAINVGGQTFYRDDLAA